MLVGNGVTIMKKVYILLFLMSFCGCTKEPNVLYGSDGREIQMVFQNFPDIPFPDKAFMNIEDSRTLGSGTNWIGTICYTVGYDAGRVFDFYVAEMPKKEWVEIAVVRAEISQMTYVRNGRAVQILIQIKGKDSAFVTITAVPNQANVKLLRE